METWTPTQWAECRSYWDRYRRWIRWAIRPYVGSDDGLAWEIAVEAYRRLLVALSSLSERPEETCGLYRLCIRRAALAHRKKDRRVREIEETYCLREGRRETPLAPPPENPQAAALAERLRGRLTSRQMEALDLWASNMSSDRAAASLGVSRTVFTKRVFTARRAARSYFAANSLGGYPC